MRNFRENKELKIKIHPFWMLLAFTARLRDSLFIYVLINLLSHYIYSILFFKTPILISYILISLVSIIFYWKNYTIEVNEEFILLKKGAFFKTQKKVDLKNIVGYSINKNIFEKLLNLSSLKLTTAEIDSKEGIKIHYINNDNLRRLLSLMQVNKDDHSYPNVDFSIDKVLLTKKAFSSVSALIFISFVYTLSNQISDFIKINIPIKNIISFFQESTFNFILGLSLLYLFSLIFSFIKTFLTYSNFKLFNNDNFIRTDHGLLKSNENLIQKDN
ncbi:PH domain-containing protein, partial [Staphylococcus intermedius]